MCVLYRYTMKKMKIEWWAQPLFCFTVGCNEIYSRMSTLCLWVCPQTSQHYAMRFSIISPRYVREFSNCQVHEERCTAFYSNNGIQCGLIIKYHQIITIGIPPSLPQESWCSKRVYHMGTWEPLRLLKALWEGPKTLLTLLTVPIGPYRWAKFDIPL